jgi:hypothetical protein
MLERATQDDDNLIMNPGEGEIARLTLQHKVIKHYMKNLILAPIDLSQPGLHILDQASADGRCNFTHMNSYGHFIETDRGQVYGCGMSHPPPLFNMSMLGQTL